MSQKDDIKWWRENLDASTTIAQMIHLLLLLGWDIPKQGAVLAEEAWQKFISLKPSLDDMLKIAYGYEHRGTARSCFMRQRAAEWAIELHKSLLLQPKLSCRQLAADELKEIMYHINWPRASFIVDRAAEVLVGMVLDRSEISDDQMLSLARAVSEYVTNRVTRNKIFSHILDISEEGSRTREFIKDALFEEQKLISRANEKVGR